MPNYCSYTMRVAGKKKENVEEFIKVIQADYNYLANKFTAPRHLFRVFEAESEDIVENNGKFSTMIYGNCAWSVYSCMMEGPATYYSDCIHEYNENFKGTTLVQESMLLNLDIEVFSKEPGIQFSEHYLIQNGEIIIDDETLYQEHYLEAYGDFEEFVEETGYDGTEEDLNASDDCYIIGGFEENFQI